MAQADRLNDSFRMKQSLQSVFANLCLPQTESRRWRMRNAKEVVKRKQKTGRCHIEFKGGHCRFIICACAQPRFCTSAMQSRSCGLFGYANEPKIAEGADLLA